MEAIDRLRQVIRPDKKLRRIEDDIYSVLPAEEESSHYDKIAGVYDLVVGTPIYNSVMWGCPAKFYTEFARRALDTSGEGLFLDAGCGSMLFTARVFGKSRRTVVAFDRSLEMLRRAKERLSKIEGAFPTNIVLLQADVFDLPFRPQSFQTVLSLSIAHLFEDTEAFVKILREQAADDDNGNIYLTSLARTGRLTDFYLSFLAATGSGGLAKPKSGKLLKEILKDVLGENAEFQIRGNFIFAAVKYK